jgi:hypothetical protein
MALFNISKRFAVIGTPPADVNELRNFVLVGSTVFTVVSTITMIMRFMARRSGAQSLRADDWLILAGYVISLMPVVCVYIRE